jgi:hypothetical protein
MIRNLRFLVAFLAVLGLAAVLIAHERRWQNTAQASLF